MKRLIALWPALLLASLPLQASHLTEEEVIALEEKCQERRSELLAPEKLEVLDTCLAAGEEGEEACREKAAQEGEMRIIGTNYRVGKYYDLPECVEAYRARKHYQVNPNLRDR
jgi:hypothetical protein